MNHFLRNFLSYIQDYIPKSFVCFREGYNKQMLINDLFAGITVGIIALPLAMAFAIGSGVPPEKGLYTAIIAGFLISLLGGSRVQIGGPTGAFVVIVYSIVQKHGYDGLAIATLMAGVMMVLMGFGRFGILLKFIPYPLTTGFTTGIALVIFSSQIKDFFGLHMETVPADFLDKWTQYAITCQSTNPFAFSIALGSLFLIFFMRKKFPRVPGAIIAIILATVIVEIWKLPVETIQSKFGGIPRTLPSPCIPVTTFDRIQELFPDAITIALLGAIESLLSAMVADGMTGYKHRSNCELVAQGFANIGSVFFGGIPATGAIARTSANIKMGAKTPIAGMTHAVVLLLLMLALAPLAAKIPLCALAAVLVFVAWNMSELEHFIDILKGPWSDALVLIITFLLTVLVDLTVAVQIGIILSALLFLKHMTDSTTIQICTLLFHDNAHEHPQLKDSDILFRNDVPPEALVFEINGPFFFGVSDLLNETLRRLETLPRYFILRMRKVPLVDSTGIRALKQFKNKCDQKGIVFLISGPRPEIAHLFSHTGVEASIGKQHIFPHIDKALAYVRDQLQSLKD